MNDGHPTFDARKGTRRLNVSDGVTDRTSDPMNMGRRSGGWNVQTAQEGSIRHDATSFERAWSYAVAAVEAERLFHQRSAKNAMTAATIPASTPMYHQAARPTTSGMIQDMTIPFQVVPPVDGVDGVTDVSGDDPSARASREIEEPSGWGDESIAKFPTIGGADRSTGEGCKTDDSFGVAPEPGDGRVPLYPFASVGAGTNAPGSAMTGVTNPVFPLAATNGAAGAGAETG
jgi:hypothetical protein